jgi:transcriptional regulator with XRE-family HTH domain
VTGSERKKDQVAKASKGKSKSLVLFGNEVKRFRQAANLSQDQTGAKIHVSGAHIGQIERGDVRCREETAEALDAALGSQGTIPSLWKQCVKSSVFPTWFDWYEVEAEATHLKSYQSMVVDGLLQTPDYAAALLKNDKEAVAARIGRQEVLYREDPPPPRVSVLLYEGVLHHEVGGKDVMREQLAHLLTMSEKPNISVQVVPEPLPSAGSAGSFVLATLPDRSEIAYAPMAARGLTLDETDDIRALSDAYDEIRGQALPIEMSKRLIQQIMEDRWTT